MFLCQYGQGWCFGRAKHLSDSVKHFWSGAVLCCVKNALTINA